MLADANRDRLRSETGTFWIRSWNVTHSAVNCDRLTRCSDGQNRAYLDVTVSYNGIYLRESERKEEALIKTRQGIVVEITAGFHVMLTQGCLTDIGKWYLPDRKNSSWNVQTLCWPLPILYDKVIVATVHVTLQHYGGHTSCSSSRWPLPVLCKVTLATLHVM